MRGGRGEDHCARGGNAARGRVNARLARARLTPFPTPVGESCGEPGPVQKGLTFSRGRCQRPAGRDRGSRRAVALRRRVGGVVVQHAAVVALWALFAQGASFIELVTGAGLFAKFILLLLLALS